MALAEALSACYICGGDQHLRSCASCGSWVCPQCRVAQQPDWGTHYHFICRHCWDYLTRRVGNAGLYPPVTDPDDEQAQS